MSSKKRVAKRAKPTDIISHWPKLIENLQFSSQEFYAKVEAALAQRNIPDLRMERVDWKEGGPLSARREYLRLTRERLIFDVCGAPFGNGFFVSLWYGERPLRFGCLAWILVLVAGLMGAGSLVVLNMSRRMLWRYGIHMTPTNVATILAAILGVALIGIVVIVGSNLDQILIQTPVIGYFYERFFRRVTLYRIDLNCMYLGAVHSAVTQVIDEISKAQGIPPLSELDRRPVFRELFQPQGGNGPSDPSDAASPSWQKRLAEQFYSWELRGRGWQMWDLPVEPEPAFAPFFGYYLDQDPESVDDGRKHTLLSGLVDWLHEKWTGQADGAAETSEEETAADPEPELWDCDGGLVELQVSLPPDLQVSKDVAEQFLLSLGSCRQTPAFEIVGAPESIAVQIVCSAGDAGHVRLQLEAHFPDVTITPRPSFLVRHWGEAEGGETVVAELGLAREFMLPLFSPRRFSSDPLTGIIAVLSDIGPGELGLLQILSRPVRHPWAESVLRSVVFADGTPLFDGVRDYVKQARAKVSCPLYGAVIRIAARSGDEQRTWDLARRLSGAFAHLSSTEGNELIPLDNEGYDPTDHEQDLLLRRSRRGGLLLNSEELASLVHLPSSSVRVGKLRGPMRKTKAAPPIILKGRSILGENEHAGEVRRVALSPEQRTRHLHVIGASGTGKSTLLLNLILQDIAAGDGVALLDPHGDLVDDVIARIPPQRANDVVLVDPADEDYSVGLNILSAHSALEKNLLASDLVSVFKRLSTSWGDQMHSVLGNAILAFLESSRGGTLLDLRRFLVEPPYRKEFLTTVQDPEVVYYWSKEFPLLTGRPQGPVLTRLDTFLRPKSIRYMVAQKQSRVDFADIMDNGRIFLARLSHGAIGEENAYLLGTLLVSKFHQIALGRQRLRESERKNFWLYVDEFQNFATPSMAAILSGARKYRLGLVLAHHEMRQLENAAPDVAGAVIAHPYTRVCFRLGDEDARKLASGFKSFEMTDLQNLSTGEAICRVERADLDFNLKTLPAPPADERIAAEVRQLIIANTRERHAVSRREIELELSRPREDAKDAVEEFKVVATPAKEKKQETIPSAPAPTLVEPKPLPAPRKVPKSEPIEPAELGRGGAQH